MSEVALHVRGLTRHFGRIAAVQDLSLEVLTGDVYGFLGPNGAGKTTAMRCILGLIRKDAGDVTVLGETDINIARRQVGAIIEVPSFHTWMTGRENLKQAAWLSTLGSATNSEIDRVLDRVGLAERAGDRAGTYSLGMKQRLGIARSLLGKPKILFLDEPTNGLDPSGMAEMRDLIRSLALHDQITIFISSHLLGEVQAVCNRVGIIQSGTLRAEGNVKELIREDDGKPVVEIGCNDHEALKAALATIDGIEVTGPGAAGRVRAVYEGIELADLNIQLVQAGVRVDSLVPAQRNLEDVFLEVTG